eukprot:TRINITY_DN57077_c0_g2_i2.p2 TRINITY_DN57077_c0_g2~~TRINITY_DN57077_c0_g2_i2.p2  ORF type:complete len:106 (+),score=5.88 TRINITY_DN57077_c0_g2_i2:41-319(+)
MTKRTQKVGIAGKFGTRYGANLRKRVKKLEISQHTRHYCGTCGKYDMRRKAVGIWYCKSCEKYWSGGAWSLSTTAATTARQTIRRLRELLEK